MAESGTSSQVLAFWHDAVNAADLDAAVACCAPDVKVLGPRGVGSGHDLVRAWLSRSGIRLVPQDELVERDGRFLVRELAQWTVADIPDGAPAEPVETWCVFLVADGKITSIARYETEADVPPA